MDFSRTTASIRNQKNIIALLFSIILIVAQPAMLHAGHLPGAQQDNNQEEKLDLKSNSTLPNILTYAALHNPGLKATFHQWQAALGSIPQARALPDPAITFAYFIREIETRVGPQRGKIGIMQQLPWFDKLKLRGQVASAAAEAAEQRYEAMKRELFYQVKIAYYDNYLAHRRIALLQDSIRLLEDREKVLQVEYTTGKAAYTGLLKLQVEIARLQQRRQSAEAILRPIAARFNRILNRKAGDELPPPLPLALPGPDEFAKLTGIELPGDAVPESSPKHLISHLVQRLRDNNPNLKLLAAAKEREKTNQRLAKRNYLPDFTIGVDYIITDESVMPGVTDSGKDPLAVMLSLHIPLWFGKHRAKLKAAGHIYQAAIFGEQEEENWLLTQLELVIFNITDTQRRMRLFKDELYPRASQAFEVTRSAFKAGAAGYLEFIEAQRNLLDIELEYEVARTDFARALAELERLI